MADHGRQPQPDLSGPPRRADGLLRAPAARSRRGGGRFGDGGRPDREPARLGQEVRMGFAIRDVAALRPGAGGRAAAGHGRAPRPARARGADAAAPDPPGARPAGAALVQPAASTGATSDTTFLDFANMLQHRAMALYYRAWADQNPPVQAERDGAGRVRAMLAALAGAGADEVAPVKLGQAAALGHQVLGAGAADRPPRRGGRAAGAGRRVRRRLDGDPARGCRPGSAARTPRSARGATLGPRSFARQSRIELRVGPLGLADYRTLLPGGERLAARCGTRSCTGSARRLDVDVRPVLRGARGPGGAARRRRRSATPPGCAPRRDARRRRPAASRAVVGLGRRGREGGGDEPAPHPRAGAAAAGGAADAARRRRARHRPQRRGRLADRRPRPATSRARIARVAGRGGSFTRHRHLERRALRRRRARAARARPAAAAARRHAAAPRRLRACGWSCRAARPQPRRAGARRSRRVRLRRRRLLLRAAAGARRGRSARATCPIRSSGRRASCRRSTPTPPERRGRPVFDDPFTLDPPSSRHRERPAPPDFDWGTPRLRRAPAAAGRGFDWGAEAEPEPRAAVPTAGTAGRAGGRAHADDRLRLGRAAPPSVRRRTAAARAAAPAPAGAAGRALLDAFLRGLGLDPADAPAGDPAARMEAFGREYRMMAEGLMQLLRIRAQEKGNARIAADRGRRAARSTR